MKTFEEIISTQELFSNLSQKSLIIVDCRYDMANPDQGYLDYKTAHIPGAFYAHLDNDLASPITPESGRHPLPNPDNFKKLIMGWNIDKSHQVVVYDSASGSMAGRLWFLLRYYGFSNVALLDGGYNKWLNEKLPVTDKLPDLNKKPYNGSLIPDSSMIVTTAEMQQIHLDGQYKIIDSRNSDRYHGKNETIDKVAGHIPGALNRFYGLNLTDQGDMKSPEELRNEFSGLISQTPIHQVIVYCGSGVTACHNLIALKHAGLGDARVYAGSWSEWIRDPNRPIAVD